MEDEHDLLCAWQASREAYDEVLARLFGPRAGGAGAPPDERLVREVARARTLEEAARRRYHASRGTAEQLI